MKVAIVTIIILLVCLVAFTYMAWAANKKVERQKYNTVKEEKGFEIRYYPKAIMASISARRHGDNKNANRNFRKLAGYIFGGNQADRKIAMTAPVYMEQDTDADRMSFVLPAGYSMADLPNPNDSDIMLHYSDEGFYAALSFGGFASENKIRNKKAALRELLRKTGYEVIGNFNYLGYNAPWDIFNRQNEIIVKISYTK